MMKDTMAILLLIVLFVYFAGPWWISGKRNCVHKKWIRAATLISPFFVLALMMVCFIILPEERWDTIGDIFGVLFFAPALVLFAWALIDPLKNG